MIPLAPTKKKLLADLLKKMVTKINGLEEENQKRQDKIIVLQRQIDILSTQVSELAFMIEGAENVHKVSKNAPLTMVAGGY